MLGPFGTRQGSLLYLLVWLLSGAALAWLLAAATGVALGAGLLFAVPLTLLYGVAAGFSSYYLCRAHPLGSTAPWRIALAFSLAALCASALWSAAAGGWNDALAEAGVHWNRSLGATIFGLGAVLYGLCSVANYLAITIDRARDFERRELQAKLTARDAELRLLRAQVDPHFLFNSLNSISALTAIDAKAAREMTLQLAEFFRRTLRLEASGRVTLEAELEMIRHYLAIEQVRFGDRLAWSEQVDDAARDCLLPPLLLQPLVENAVKHGVARRLEGGTVRLHAVRAASLLRISVENERGDDQPARPGNGHGLANVRERLTHAYAHEASASWREEDGMFRVDLVLPAQTAQTKET
jgi:two-component system, LytTR family, sensor histidine kinase AlgZ